MLSGLHGSRERVVAEGEAGEVSVPQWATVLICWDAAEGACRKTLAEGFLWTI